MNQQDLLSDVPTARNTDPATSHIAAAKATRTNRAAQQHKVLAVVEKYPNRTSAEIAVLAGMERHIPARRLPELRQAGLVKNGERRVCTATGNPSMVWRTK